MIGKHLACDFYGVSSSQLGDVVFLENRLKHAVDVSGATILSIQSYTFTPQGLTVLIAISESHVSIHTWPEHQYLAFDAFTCGNNVSPQIILDVFADALRYKERETTELKRGKALM